MRRRWRPAAAGSSAFFYALAIIWLRKMGPNESSEAIVLHFSLVAAATLLLWPLPAWQTPGERSLGVPAGHRNHRRAGTGGDDPGLCPQPGRADERPHLPEHRLHPPAGHPGVRRTGGNAAARRRRPGDPRGTHPHLDTRDWPAGWAASPLPIPPGPVYSSRNDALGPPTDHRQRGRLSCCCPRPARCISRWCSCRGKSSPTRGPR